LGSNNKYRINLTNRLTFGNNISHFFHFFGRRNFFSEESNDTPSVFCRNKSNSSS
jgi:hypothetical protein